MIERLIAHRPEIEVLLRCARTRVDEAGASRVRELACGALDWDALYTGAARHGLLPLMHWHLSAVASDVAPLHVLREFRREFEENAARNFVLTAELLEILSTLESRGARVATYKGPALAVSAYDNLLLRSFCDLDLLMDKTDLPLVRETLLARGYKQQFHSNEESIEYAHSFVQREEGGGEAARGVVVEAHWSVTPRHYALPPVPPGALGRLRSLVLQDREVLALSPEDQLLVLCWHGYKHRWSRLEWVACVAEIVRRSADSNSEVEKTLNFNPKLDWPHLLETAHRAGSVRLLWLGLGLARELLDAPLPAKVLDAMRADRVLDGLLQPLQTLLLTAPGDENSRRPELKMFRLNSRERWRDKVLYCWRLARAPRQVRWPSLRPARE